MSQVPVEPDFALHPNTDQAREDAERLFERVAAELKALLPPSADIHHIGATAVAGCRTKGDLDILVRVPAAVFGGADEVLAGRFARNVGSDRTETFSAFEDASTSPHLGIQLIVAGSEGDDFHIFVDALRRDPQLVARYNALKCQFDGQPMDVYRAAKSAFIRDALYPSPS
jgi:GrpB-like predicted nucleotidyltransferase (UPF0157 family)